MGTYLFNKHVIQHRFCPACGIHPYGEGTDPKGNRMAAINIRCIEGIELRAGAGHALRRPFDVSVGAPSSRSKAAAPAAPSAIALTTRPLFVHCCHCRWCQRETGTAFALNAMIEAERVQLLAGEVEFVADAVVERQGPEDRALSAVPHRALEPLRRRRRRDPLRARRHAR